MTKTDTAPPPPENVDGEAPTAFDPLDALTIAELDAGSRLLKASIVKAVTEGTPEYERAFAILAYLHERRVDRETKPDELLRRFTSMSFREAAEHLQTYGPGAAEDADRENPTGPGPA